MSPRPIGKTIAERYDISLRYAKDECVPPEARPAPTRYWPKENVALLERFQAWLVEGGTSEYTANMYYVPVAGHSLGLNLKPHEQLDLDGDLERALEYVQAKGVGESWLRVSRNGLNKFRRFLRSERGWAEVPKAKPFDIALNTAGLPAWLVSELERFQRVQQRNWRTARLEQRTRCFWSAQLSVWRFLCEQRNVQKLDDLRRQDVLDYLDDRLNAGHSISGVNNELRSLLSFLAFLQDEGYAVRQSLLRFPNLRLPDRLPKFLTDEQVRLLRDDFEGRVANAITSAQRRDARMDRAIFYLLWQCGLRTGEVEELRLEDLDLNERKISIRDGKGRKDRTVYVTDTTIRAIQEYLAVRGSGSGDHVFLYRNAPLGGALIWCRIRHAGERTGVKVHPHSLRHTCATQLLNAGCRITSIQRFLGHKRLNTTMVYARVHDQTVADDYFKAMEQVEQQLALPIACSDQPPSTSKMLSLVDSLFNSRLSPDQAEIASALRSGLFSLVAKETKSLSIRAFVESG
jgi:integrase/recombinase XerD